MEITATIWGHEVWEELYVFYITDQGAVAASLAGKVAVSVGIVLGKLFQMSSS